MLVGYGRFKVGLHVCMCPPAPPGSLPDSALTSPGPMDYDFCMSEDGENGPASGRSVPHPKRSYEERQRRHLKDVDSADRVMKAKALFWSFGVVIVGFAALSLAGGGALETKMLWLIRSGIVAAAVFVYFAALAVAEGGGSLAGTIYHPSGKSTPVKHEYFLAESLAARGRHEAAAAWAREEMIRLRRQAAADEMERSG